MGKIIAYFLDGSLHGQFMEMKHLPEEFILPKKTNVVTDINPGCVEMSRHTQEVYKRCKQKRMYINEEDKRSTNVHVFELAYN